MSLCVCGGRRLLPSELCNTATSLRFVRWTACCFKQTLTFATLVMQTWWAMAEPAQVGCQLALWLPAGVHAGGPWTFGLCVAHTKLCAWLRGSRQQGLPTQGPLAGLAPPVWGLPCWSGWPLSARWRPCGCLSSPDGRALPALSGGHLAGPTCGCAVHVHDLQQGSLQGSGWAASCLHTVTTPVSARLSLLQQSLLTQQVGCKSHLTGAGGVQPLQAVPRPLERLPSFVPEQPVPNQAMLCQKLRGHASALTAALVLCDTG